MNSFSLTIATVSTTLFDGEVYSVAVPGSLGDMVILAHHEPLISTLKKGSIVVEEKKGGKQRFEIKNGILEVSNNKVVILS